MTYEKWAKAKMKEHGVKSGKDLLDRLIEAQGDPKPWTGSPPFRWAPDARPTARKVYPLRGDSFAVVVKSKVTSVFAALVIRPSAPEKAYIEGINWYASESFASKAPRKVSKEAWQEETA